MSLELRKNSKWWYGKFTLQGKARVLSLKVKVEGMRPATLADKGDERFERSRVRANDKFLELKAEITDPARSASRLRRIHELQSGTSLKPLPIDSLKEYYRKKQRKRPISPDHEEQSVERINRFCTFMHEEYPRVNDLRLVLPHMAIEFMAAQQARGLTLATMNRIRESLVAAFYAAMKLGGLASNPFTELVKYDEQAGQVHRVPFSAAHVAKIFGVLDEAPVIGPVIVAALSTAMRRKNCALLEREHVDLVNNLIRVQTYKTSVWVTIPILPALRKVLEKMPDHGKYCFPEAAEMYLKNPDGLTWRFTQVLISAGVLTKQNEPQVPLKGRVRAPSTQGIAACKTTFCTLALMAGIPEALLCKVVGNKCVQLVRDHYFQPGQKDFNDQFLAKLPPELTGADPVEPLGAKLDRLIKLASEIQAHNWSRVAAELTQGLRELKDQKLG